MLRENNLNKLIAALERRGSPFDVITVDTTGQLVPEVSPDGPVMVSGATRMATIAAARGWSPGSFLNENFRFDLWLAELGSDLLNSDATVCRLGEVQITAPRFLRPVEDSKAFDGKVFDRAGLDELKTAHPDLADCFVATSVARTLYREYRLFVVAGEIVTGSLYRQGGQPLQSPDVDPEVVAYGRSILARWQPAEAFVLDVGLSDLGYRVVEFNNINGCGFYAADVDRYVEAIESSFS